MKAIALILIAVVAVGVVNGCSQESRDEAIDRATSAARALNGEVEGKTPDVVRKQQEAERKRQNSEWTAENQAKHPVEYCQAQLKTIDEMASKLEAEAHKLNTTRSAQSRKVQENDEIIKKMTKQLADAKAAYRAADAAGTWPMTFNGYQLSQQKAQEFIVQTNQKLTTAQAQAQPLKGLLTRIERRLTEIQKEQVKLVQTREKVTMTLSAVQTEQVIEGERGISDALAALNDSLDSLGGFSDEPSFEDLSAPTAESETADAFNALMAE